MLFPNFGRVFTVAASRFSRFSPALAALLCAVHLLSCPTSIAHAAIVGTGDVTPTNPATWTSTTDAYIGGSSTGAVTVNGGSGLLSGHCSLGGSTTIGKGIGTATVTGPGSTWTSGGIGVG